MNAALGPAYRVDGMGHSGIRCDPKWRRPLVHSLLTNREAASAEPWPSKFSLSTNRLQQPKGAHEGVGTRRIGASQPISPGKADSPSRGAIAFEELITAAASATTAGAAIAIVVVRLIASLYHFLVPVWRTNAQKFRKLYVTEINSTPVRRMGGKKMPWTLLIDPAGRKPNAR